MKRSFFTPQALSLCALFTALIAVGAFLQIPLPVIPFTMQTLFVMLAGLLLGKKWGAISCAVYLLLGLAGIPIFTGGGGIGYVLKPTFGYLIGFVLGAWVIGAIVYDSGAASYRRMLLASFAGLGVLYLFGTGYYYLLSTIYLGKTVAIWPMLVSCVFATLPTDIILAFGAAFLAKRLRPHIRHVVH